MERLRYQYFEDSMALVLFYAGLPRFARNFSRDVIEASLMIDDHIMLRDQLIFGNLKQAKKQNPHSGAEPWKYHHEIPGVILRPGLSTEYNSSDATGLYLIGHKFYEEKTGDKSLTDQFKSNLHSAIGGYIFPHINSLYQFEEDPRFAGAKEFALFRTDWKDSITPGRTEGKVIYPVVYPSIQAIYINALRAASDLLKWKELKSIASKMKDSLSSLFDKEIGNFYLAWDKEGPVSGISSDGLAMLTYLQPEDIEPERLLSIINSSKILETKAGYLCLEPKLGDSLKYDYHARVWPKDQANIHRGAEQFKIWYQNQENAQIVEALDHVLEVSSRVMKYLKTDPETLKVKNGRVKKAGCDPQLWTITAKKYFNKFSF